MAARTANFTSIGISVLAGFTFMVCFIMGVPFVPLAAYWPQFCSIYLVPKLLHVAYGTAIDQTTSQWVIGFSIIFSALMAVLDLYALISLATWLYYSVVGLLSSTAVSEFSATAHILLFIIYMAFAAGDVIFISSVIQIKNILKSMRAVLY